MEKKEKYRNRNFRLELYPDDESHAKALKKIKKEYDYALILHDKDLYEEDVIRDDSIVARKGETKKPHYHVVVKFHNPKWNTALAEELGITTNYIMECDKFIKALQYLIHYNDPKKYQYSIDEVEGCFKQQLFRSIQNDGKDEGEKASELQDFIDSYDGIVDVPMVARYAQKMGLWDVLRRSTLLFIKIIDKHNELVYQREKALEDYNGVFKQSIYQVDFNEFIQNNKLT